MFSLDYLGMARGTAQFLAPAHLFQMRRMIEGDVFETDLARSLEIPRRMTSRFQAGGVLDLSPGLGSLVGVC